MNNGPRVLLHPISAAATALILTLACAGEASAQTAPSGENHHVRSVPYRRAFTHRLSKKVPVAPLSAL